MAGSIFQILALVAFATRFVVAAPAPAPVFVTILNPIAQEAADAPFTATIEGVDSQGRTTYVFGEEPDVATFVEGSDYFSFTNVVADDTTTTPTGGECELQGSNGVCTFVEGDLPVATITQQAFPLVFDVAATATPNAAPPAAVASAAGGPAPTSTPTQKPNSAQRTSTMTSVFGVLVSASLAYYFIIAKGVVILIFSIEWRNELAYLALVVYLRSFTLAQQQAKKVSLSAKDCPKLLLNFLVK
ncbi:hypothetical protein C8R44DRAFT_853085 [Mycena epipterygia]|nr:hypothetical protein C8R44DRAFT_853085 [Mycena epipterygia]